MVPKYTFEESINVGIVQTTLNAVDAWPIESSAPQISVKEDENAWFEICKAVRSFHSDDNNPDMIIFPELSIPRTRLNDFDRLLCALDVLAIAGIDYDLDKVNHIVKNEGIFFVPNNYSLNRPSRACTRIIFGKTYPAPGESIKLKELNPAWSYQGDNKVYIFDCGKFGRVGVSICYDFMDIERALMYRGKIQHLIVIAYNRDIGMFQSLADSLSRTVFCNVVVCNTGFYGGSLAVSPYKLPHKRTIYSHYGNGLFTTQIIKLPVSELIKAQSSRGEKNDLFKDPPPGIEIKEILRISSETILEPRQIED